MEKLERFAREGWILESFTPFGYKLRQGTPQDVAFALDYQKDADSDYFSYFEEGGWSHVCSAGNSMHIFRAPAGTPPIYTDNSSLLTKYETEKRKTGIAALYALFAILLLYVLRELSHSNWMPDFIGTLALIFGGLAYLVLIFTALPFFGYAWKVRKLKKLHC
nr:DUF2812 domain-containing protein [Lentibacillus sp. JNUCC-1]